MCSNSAVLHIYRCVLLCRTWLYDLPFYVKSFKSIPLQRRYVRLYLRSYIQLYLCVTHSYIWLYLSVSCYMYVVIYNYTSVLHVCSMIVPLCYMYVVIYDCSSVLRLVIYDYLNGCNWDGRVSNYTRL